LLCAHALWPAAALLILRAWRLWTGAAPGMTLSLENAAGSLIFTALPFGILTGLLFPPLCRLQSGGGASGNAVSAIGSIYSLESLGSLVAGLLFGFAIVGRVEPLVALLCPAALICANALRLHPRSAAPLFLISILLLGFSAPMNTLSASWRWRAIAGGMEQMAALESRYQRLELGRLDNQYSLLEGGQFAESFPDPAAVAQAHFLASEAFLGGEARDDNGVAKTNSSLQPRGARILMIGGGAAGLAPELLRYSNARIDYVEPDPAVLELLRGHLPPESAAAMRNSRMAVHAIDGRRYIREMAEHIRDNPEEERFRLVIVRVPDPTSAALNRYFTSQFYEQLRAIISEDGIVATRVSSAVNYFGSEVSEYGGSIFAAMQSAFPRVLATPGEEAWLLASPRADDRLTSDPETLARRFEASGLHLASSFRPAYFRMIFQPDHTAQANSKFRAAASRARDYSRINSDDQPVAYLYGLRFWGQFSSKASGRFFNWVAGLSPRPVWMACGAFLLIAIALCGILRRPRSALAAGYAGAFAIVISGLCSMSASLLLLLSYQNRLGSLYGEIAILLALFMAGLAAGGASLKRPREACVIRMEKHQSATNAAPVPLAAASTPLRLLLGWEALFAAVFLMIAAIGRVSFARLDFAGPSFVNCPAWVLIFVHGAAMFLLGFMSGAEFPLIGHVRASQGIAAGRVAAWLESADHLGAMAGALLTTLFLVPILGIGATFLLLALAKAAAALMLRLSAH